MYFGFFIRYGDQYLDAVIKRHLIRLLLRVVIFQFQEN